MGRILLNKVLRGIFRVVLTGDMTNIHVVLNELTNLFYYRFLFTNGRKYCTDQANFDF